MTVTARTSFAHFRTHIREGQEFDADDPIVAKFPHLFVGDEVEQATAAPGEKRSAPKSVRKAVKKSATRKAKAEE